MNAAVIVITRAFIDVCLLHKKPQDLPVSTELLAVCLLVYTISSFLLALISQTMIDALIAGIVEVLLVVTMTYILLKFINVPERWLQTTTAFSGTGAIFSFIAMPLFFWIDFGSQLKSAGQPVAYIMIVLLVIWNIAVMAHIFRHALSTSFTAGVFVSLFYVGVISSTISIVATYNT